MSTSATGSRSKYTEDYIPIKSISNGMITLDNGIKVSGVKIMPKNLFMLDYDDQTNVLIGFKNLYNSLDYEFWIVVADRPVDISVYLAQLQLLYNSVQSPVIRKMIMEDLNKANMFTSNNVVDTEYYLLFRDKNIETIQKRVRNVINGLGACGISSYQTTNEDLRVILNNFLNGGTDTGFGTVMS
jgi:hypothetical protein